MDIKYTYRDREKVKSRLVWVRDIQ